MLHPEYTPPFYQIYMCDPLRIYPSVPASTPSSQNTPHPFSTTCGHIGVENGGIFWEGGVGSESVANVNLLKIGVYSGREGSILGAEALHINTIKRGRSWEGWVDSGSCRNPPRGIVQDLPRVDSGAPTILPGAPTIYLGIIWEGVFDVTHTRQLYPYTLA